jgi:hypothetical protein
METARPPIMIPRTPHACHQAIKSANGATGN